MSYPPASGPSYTPDPYSSLSGGSAPQAGYGGYAGYDGYAGATGYQDPFAGAQQQGQFTYNPYQPPAAHGAFPPIGPGAPAPAVKSRTAPVTLLISGLVLCIVSAGIFIAALVTVMNVAGSLAQVASNGTARAELDGASVYGLYGNGISGCTVTDPDGDTVKVSTDGNRYTSIDDQALIGSFSTTVSGTYTITCTTLGSSRVYIGHVISADSVLGGVAAVFMSVIAALVGLPLLIAGIIWLIVRNSHNKKVLQAQIAANYSDGHAGFGWPAAY